MSLLLSLLYRLWYTLSLTTICSYSESKSLASLAASYISSRGGSDSVVKSYFGTSYSRANTVLTTVANENSSTRTLNCNDPYGACSNGVIAYTLIATTNIYFCSIFYSEKTTSALCSGTTVASRNIRGATVLHEMTHATSDTDDIGYGCAYDISLASSSPSRAVTNADNYNVCPHFQLPIAIIADISPTVLRHSSLCQHPVLRVDS